MNKYAIIGLGWLGLELAKQMQAEGKNVWGTSTTKEKVDTINKQGISATFFSIDNNQCYGSLDPFIKDTTHVFVNIPPGLRHDSEADYTNRIKNLIDLLPTKTVQHLVFVSSTSVFQNKKGIPEYTEKSLPNSTTKSGLQLLEAEILIEKSGFPKIQIIRMGGLIGKNRHPAKFLSGRQGVSSPQAPVNMITQEDAVNLSKCLLSYNKSGIYHGVYPNYPTRRVFYNDACKKLNLKGLGFNDYDENLGKKISSLKTVNELKFEFLKQP